MIGENNNSKQIENFGSSSKLAGDAEMEDKCPLFPSLFIFPRRSASFWSFLQETGGGGGFNERRSSVNMEGIILL